MYIYFINVPCPLQNMFIRLLKIAGQRFDEPKMLLKQRRNQRTENIRAELKKE